MYSPRPTRLALLVLCLVLAAASARAQAPPSPLPPAEDVPAVLVPEAEPFVTRPPIHAGSTFVPLEELLKRADRRQPVRADGAIVTRRPAPSAVPVIPDAATRYYQDVTYPLRLRHFDSQIRLLEADLINWQERVAVYRYFNKAGALMVDYQNAQLAQLTIEEQLRNLRYERMLFIRHHNRESQLHREGLLVEPALPAWPEQEIEISAPAGGVTLENFRPSRRTTNRRLSPRT